MDKINHTLVSVFIAGLVFAAALGISSCAPKPADFYSVRGMVVSVEQDPNGPSRVTILHEAIPDFKNQAGQVVGMEPMAMTFAADAAMPSENLQPRAKIQFVFEVHWDAAERLVLKEIQPLDSETELEFNGYSVEMA
jgi:hypothetical protein